MRRRPFTLPWSSKRAKDGPQDPVEPGTTGPGLVGATPAVKPEAAATDRAGARFNPVRSIGIQLFIYFFLIVVVSVSSVGFLSYDRSRQLIETQVMEAQRLTAVQAAEKLQLILRQYEDTSMEIMMLPEIEEITSMFRLYPDDVMGQLDTRRALETRLNNFSFSDSSIVSNHMLAMDPVMPTLNLGMLLKPDAAKEMEWYQRAVEADGRGVWIGTTRKGPSDAQTIPAFGYARVIKDKATFKPAFMSLIELTEDRLQKVFEGALGEGSLMYLLDENGVIISSVDDTEIGQPFPTALTGENGSIQETFLGEEMVISHSQLPGGWRLVGAQPFGPLVAGTQVIWDLTILLLLFGMAAAVVIGWMVARRIGTPLTRMSALMKQAEDGDLSVQSPYAKRLDEIGTLATGFNEMIGNIRKLVEESHESAQQVMNTAGELSEASRRTATSAKEIAVATEQIAIGASNVAVEAEKVADVTTIMGDRMAGTTRANEEMAAAAADIRRSSQQGTEYMHALSEKTNETEQLTQSMVRKVEELQKSTRSIRDILELLNNITKQTNILSLNATIEAARAGEAGRGFMVVADEIRKLADQSKQSIETVGSITDKIRAEIDETVGLMGQAYPMFQEQIASVKQSNEIFLTVNDRMAEFVSQLDGVSEAIQQLESTQRTLSDAMSNVSAVAQQSSATSEEVASLTSDQLQVGDSLVGLAGRLEDVSVRLRDTLNKFRL